MHVRDRKLVASHRIPAPQQELSHAGLTPQQIQLMMQGYQPPMHRAQELPQQPINATLGQQIPSEQLLKNLLIRSIGQTFHPSTGFVVKKYTNKR